MGVSVCKKRGFMGGIRRDILGFVGALLLLVSSGCQSSNNSMNYQGRGATLDPASDSSEADPDGSIKRDIKPNIVIEKSSLEPNTLVFLVEMEGDKVTVKEQSLTADVPTHFLDSQAPLVVRLEDGASHILFEGGLEDPTLVQADKWEGGKIVGGSEGHVKGPVEFFLKIPKRAGAKRLVFYRTLYEVVPMEGGGMKLSPYGQTVIGGINLDDF